MLKTATISHWNFSGIWSDTVSAAVSLSYVTDYGLMRPKYILKYTYNAEEMAFNQQSTKYCI
jgi:hypothetical protein